MNTLRKNMKDFFNEISKEELEKLLIENGYNKIKSSSDFGYKLKNQNRTKISYSNNYNFSGVSQTINEELGEAA